MYLVCGPVIPRNDMKFGGFMIYDFVYISSEASSCIPSDWIKK